MIQSGKKSNSTYKRTSIIEPKSTYLFLFSEYGVKLAKDDLFANILPNMLELTDYEEQYMTPEERKNRGFQVKSKFYKKHGATFFYDVTRKLGPLDFTQYRSKSSSF